MNPLPRLRQIALAASDLQTVAGELQRTFAWADPYHDPGVAEFGLENAVFSAGDTFVEVVAPVKPGTAAGRYLERRAGDSGYMAIFQVADLTEARKRIAESGIRVVWQVDLPDIAGTHLHPKDVPGAIVSIDWADPPASWRWGGPFWTGKGSEIREGAVTAITLEVADPERAAAKWAIGLDATPVRDSNGATIPLEGAGQTVRFVPSGAAVEGGITEVTLEGGSGIDLSIGGVRFRTEPSP
ncbi:MAG TPA: hypothetical protein VFV02_06135 [Acidimicrobiales bacterium]|nr:hypothetical protein [Acidimicrobiales bacterium]